MRQSITSAALVVASLVSSASADIVTSYYISKNHYHWKVAHMPDFDQKREYSEGHPGLPNDGAMYCAPTAVMNLFAYAANHGMPWLEPWAQNWKLQSLYNEATERIAELGSYMYTTDVGGTGGEGWSNGAQLWLNNYDESGLLTRHLYYTSNNYTVRAYKMGKKAVQGSIVAFAYGRYEVVGSYAGHPLLGRTGGHVVTLNEISNSPGSPTVLLYRDPADDDYNSSQSTFKSKEVDAIAPEFAFYADPNWVRTVAELDFDLDDGKHRIIDAFMTLKPMGCLSYLNTGGTNWDINLAVAAPFNGWAGGSVVINGFTAISELAIDADGDDALAIVNTAIGVTALKRIDTSTGELTTIGTFDTLKRLTTGRDGLIYAHDGSKIYCLKPDGTLEGATSSVGLPTALAWDDTNDQLVILSVANRRITRLTKTLGFVSFFNVPTAFPMSGDGSVDVNPFDGHVYFDTSASNAIGSLQGTAAPFTFSNFLVPGVSGPRGIGASDNGKLLISTPTGLKVCKQTGDRRGGGSWVIDTDHPLNGIAVSDRIGILHSRTNFDPALHSGPSWNNLDPAELIELAGDSVPDCVSDISLDGTIDAADIALLLGAWSTSSESCDLNADGIVNAADLAVLLGSWGPCP